MNTVVQPSTKTRIFICAWCRAGPTKPRSARMSLCRDISSVLYQVFDVSALGMQGTGPVLVLVGALGLPWLTGSGLDVSKMTPHYPGAMVVWAQQKWDDPHLHLMLYVTSEPLCSSQSGCKTELQLLKLKLDLCASISFWVSWPQQNCPIPFLRDVLSSFKASTPAKNKLVNLVGACEYNLLWKAPLLGFYLGFSLNLSVRNWGSP